MIMNLWRPRTICYHFVRPFIREVQEMQEHFSAHMWWLVMVLKTRMCLRRKWTNNFSKVFCSRSSRICTRCIYLAISAVLRIDQNLHPKKVFNLVYMTIHIDIVTSTCDDVDTNWIPGAHRTTLLNVFHISAFINRKLCINLNTTPYHWMLCEELTSWLTDWLIVWCRMCVRVCVWNSIEHIMIHDPWSITFLLFKYQNQSNNNNNHK